MAYEKVWLGRQDSFPGWQDWNALVGDVAATRASFSARHVVVDGPVGNGQPQAGEHNLREVPRGTAMVVPQFSGTAVTGTRRELVSGSVVGHTRVGRGEYVVYTRGLSSTSWADACPRARGDARPRRVHVERFEAPFSDGDVWVPAGASTQGFFLRLYEWDGAAWAAADFELSITVSSPTL